MSEVIDDKKFEADKKNTVIIYALYALSLVAGITCLAAIVMNYVMRDDIKDSILQSHFRWQMRTFWYSLLWGLIGLVLCVIIIGFFILFANLIWYIYRIVKGWSRLNENKPMYTN